MRLSVEVTTLYSYVALTRIAAMRYDWSRGFPGTVSWLEIARNCWNSVDGSALRFLDPFSSLWRTSTKDTTSRRRYFFSNPFTTTEPSPLGRSPVDSFQTTPWLLRTCKSLWSSPWKPRFASMLPLSPVNLKCLSDLVHWGVGTETRPPQLVLRFIDI